MDYFEPIFILDEFKVIVMVMVPNACYLKKETYAGVPSDVPTPNDGNYHHTIVLDYARIAEGVLPGDVSFSAVCSLIPDFLHVFELEYGEDPNGNELTVYVATVGADGEPKEKKRKRLEKDVTETQ